MYEPIFKEPKSAGLLMKETGLCGIFNFSTLVFQGQKGQLD